MTTQEIINLSTSGVQAITTIVLAIITYKQMGHSRATVESMERSMKADFLPVLMLAYSAYNSTDKILNIQLTNCGKGLARKPKIIFPGQPDITINSLNVGESGNATIEYNIEYVLKKIDLDARKIIIEYQDVFDRKITTEANLIEFNNFGPSGDKRGMAWDFWTPIIP